MITANHDGFQRSQKPDTGRRVGAITNDVSDKKIPADIRDCQATQNSLKSLEIRVHVRKDSIPHILKSDLKGLELARGRLPINCLIGYIAGKMILNVTLEFPQQLFVRFGDDLYITGA